MTSFIGAVALFALGCAIAAALPRPLEEDKRTWSRKKQTSQESESRRPPPLSARRSNGSTTRARTPPRARIARAFERAPERRLAPARSRAAAAAAAAVRALVLLRALVRAPLAPARARLRVRPVRVHDRRPLAKRRLRLLRLSLARLALDPPVVARSSPSVLASRRRARRVASRTSSPTP